MKGEKKKQKTRKIKSTKLKWQGYIYYICTIYIYQLLQYI